MVIIMKRRLVLGLILASLVLLTPARPTAQVSGLALATWQDGSVFDGFIGPFRMTPTGVDMGFSVLCYGPNPRGRTPVSVVASVPDGTSLAQLRTVVTTAVVDACAGVGFTVPRTLVFLPVLQAGL